MPPTRKTTRSAASIDLNKLGPNDYYDATLSGHFVSATAHSRVLTGTPLLLGDTLTATGRNSSLFGGAGKDSLVALGSNNYLTSGTGASMLVGTTLRGASTTLQGNGRSSLIGAAGNDVFIVSEGDKIGGVAGGTNSIRTGINNFSLTDTARRGAGVANVQNLIFTGLGGATLAGNALNGSLIGSTTAANSLIAGTSTTSAQLAAAAAKGSATLTVTSTDGLSASQLITGNGIPAGTMITSINDMVVTISKALTSSLAKNTSFIATGTSTLVGGSNSDTLVGNGRSFLIGGGGDDSYIISQSGAGSTARFDKVTESAIGGTDTARTTIPNFNLADTLRYGSGIANIENLTFNDGGTLISGIVTLAGNTNDNTIIGARNASNFLSSGGGADSLVGGAGNDTLMGNRFSSLNGGDGDNTYYVYSQGDVIQETGISTVNGSSVIGVSSGLAPFVYDLSASGNQSGAVTRLQYTGASTATLSGGANRNTIIGGLGTNSLMAGSGIASLVGNSRSDTLNDNRTLSTMSGGLGNDYYLINNIGSWIEEMPGASGGIDTILLGTGSSLDLSESKFANGTGIENVTYLGISDFYLIGNENSNLLDLSVASNATLRGSFTDDPLISAGSDTLIGAQEGNNLFIFVNPNDLAISSVNGGRFTDTLQIVGPGNISDQDFFNTESVEAVQFIASSSILLGNNAMDAGLATLFGSDQGDTLNQDAGFTSSLTLLGGEGSDLYSFADPIQLVANSLIGGAEIDTLEVRAGGYLDESSFLQVQGIEVLKVSSASTVFLGTTAFSAGITSLVGSNGDDFVVVTPDSGYDSAGISLDGQEGSDTLQGFGSTKKNVVDTLVGGSGADLFVIGSTDGNAYSSEGIDDYAWITDFNVAQGDKLQLFGTPSYYSSDVQTSGIDIYFQDPSLNLGSPGELIARLKDVSEFDLVANVSYATTELGIN